MLIDKRMDKENVVCRHTMEYYSTMKNGILSCETCLDLEALMLCEISHRKANATGSHCHVKSKNKTN